MRVRWWAVGVFGVLLVLFVSACSEETEESHASLRVGVADQVALRCSDAIDRIDEPPSGYGVVAGVVALPTSESAGAALQTADFGGPDAASRLFAKTGLLVRSGRGFELRVPQGFHDRVAIGWGNRDTETHRLVVPPCESVSAWLVFAGGISIADPECITLEVASGASIESFTMGIGSACPGQEPPAGPSDG